MYLSTDCTGEHDKLKEKLEKTEENLKDKSEDLSRYDDEDDILLFRNQEVVPEKDPQEEEPQIEPPQAPPPLEHPPQMQDLPRPSTVTN
ncbi:hypothetical protein Taro_003821, partial [Colocasia esculenta]|nr:hypothetical protein [Colocasia esculenta]